MNYKSVLFFLGINSLFVSFFSILNILYSIYFDFVLDLNSYLITLITSLIIGSSFWYVGRNSSKNITLVDQITFIVLSFFLIPLLFSIPYFFSIYNIGLLNSYFESVSGFTTTGFSIIENIKDIAEKLEYKERFVMLDHDDLYSNLLKSNISSAKFSYYVNNLIEFCKSNNITLLRTVGIIFTDEDKNISDYVR